MKVIKQGQITEDPIVHLGDDDPIPSAGRFTVSLTRWMADRESLRAHTEAGVRLNGADALEQIVPDLDAVATVAIEFPSFNDGRGYSLARLLREHQGYRGELRATGDILRDQLFFLSRCGFDVFEVRADKSIEDALEAFRDFSVTYQPASDGRAPVYRL